MNPLILSAGSNLAQTGLNALISNNNRQRSLEDQKKMARFNYNLEMNKWHDTNYQAQLAEMKKAGLNVSKMYAGSGGGGGMGATSMTQGGGQQLGGMNPFNNTIGMSASEAADIDLKKSQAELNRTEAHKKENADTQLINAQISELLSREQLNNANFDKTNVEKTILEWDRDIKAATYQDSIDMIKTASSKLSAELKAQNIENENRQKIIDKQLQLWGADILVKNTEVQVNKEQAEWLIQQVQQSIKQLELNEKNIDQRWNEVMKKIESDNRNTDKIGNSMMWSAGIAAAGGALQTIAKLIINPTSFVNTTVNK